MAKTNSKSSADANMLSVSQARPKSMCTYAIAKADKKIRLAFYRKGEWLVPARVNCRKDRLRHGMFMVVDGVEYVSDRTIEATMKRGYRRMAREG